MAVYGYVSEIGGADMVAFASEITFHPNLDSHLHGSVEDTVHGGLEDHEIADSNGDEKVQMVGRSSDYVAARMAMGSERTGDINPMHEAPAEQGIERIGVIGQHEFHHLGN